MAYTEIANDLFFIERGYLNGNHFVYRSEAPVLIDTGYVVDFNETKRLIEATGVRVADVSLIINTHTHCDHIGGNRIIQEASGCGIALHAVGRHHIDTKDDWATWWKYYHQQADFFQVTRKLEDGEVIALGPHDFDVIYTPGHASDGIVLYNRDQKILLSSDTLWEDDVAVMTLRVEGSTALFRALESLKRIESLDVDMVYPGHGRPFSDMQKAIGKSRLKIEGYIKDRQRIGSDLLKKIIVYTVLMKKSVDEGAFFPYLMKTYWFPETVDLYFNGEYEAKYSEITKEFFSRKVLLKEDGKISTTVKP